MESKELILATKAFVHENRAKSYWLTLSSLALLIASFLGALFLDYLLLKIVLGIITSLLMMRFFVIYHDYQHHAILHKSWLAKGIFRLYGLYMLAPESIWKRSHDYHHKHNCKISTASIGSYPVATTEEFINASRREQRAYLWSRNPVNMILGYFTFFIYGMCIQSFKSNPSKHWDSILAVVIHIAFSVLIGYQFGLVSYIFAVFVPFFISLMIGAYLFYAQHNFPGVVFKTKRDWEYSLAALQSSSYFKMNKVMQWFSANIGFHHIHHLNARIPFYRLPEVMKKMEDLQHPAVTTFKLSDIVACLKLKVWDPATNKMLTKKELYEFCKANWNLAMAK